MRRSLYFLFKAWESMRREALLTLATVTMLSVIFLLFNCFTLIAGNISNLAENWIGSVRMSAFLTAEATPEDAQNLAVEFKKLPEVNSVFYVSQDDAQMRFLADYPGSESILAGLPKNPLPASLELELDSEAIDMEALEDLAGKLKAQNLVEDALYGKELFNKLTALINLIHLIGTLVGMGLVVAALFLTANTIRLNLYARQDEIMIMQLVGATRWFIRWPYLIEGLLQGLLGAGFSLLLAYGLFILTLSPISEALLGSIGRVTLTFLSSWSIALELAGGALLGMVGSFLALGRFWRMD